MALTESEKNYLQLVQGVRLLDVIFIGPIMIYSGVKGGGKVGKIMILLGILTIVFNAYNFYLHKKSDPQ